jgi:hypothetical protein
MQARTAGGKTTRSGTFVKWLLAATCTCTIAMGADLNRVIYVDAAAQGTNDGSSWTNAYRYLQDALADADAMAKPVEIRIAQGTYKPDQGIGIKAGNKEATFRMLNGVTIKGGYAGLNAPDPNAWDPSLYKTLLWGDLAGNDDFAHITTANDNSHHVVTASGTDVTAILEGVTIGHGAYLPARVFSGDGGCGIHSRAGSATIRSCIFSHNVTTNASGTAMLNYDGAAARLDGCSFENNHGHNALYDVDSSTVLTNCRFIDNDGVAVVEQTSQLECEDCSFTGNRSVGLSLGANSHAALSNCVSTANHSGIVGGSESCSLVCTDCVFTGNGGTAPYQVGAVCIATGAFLRCHFRDNIGAAGGAIYSYHLTLEDCAFIHNAATSFGAVRCITGDIQGCLFAGNRAEWETGALYIRSQCKLTNCTFAGNRSRMWRTVRQESSMTEIVMTNCVIHDNYCEDPISGGESGWGLGTTASYSCLPPSPWQLDIQPVGCFDVDPCFVNPGYWDPNGTANDPNDDFWVNGDYHLKSQAGRWDPKTESWVKDHVTSPCIDAGDPNSPVGDEPPPNGGRINMGTYGGTAEASKSL